PELVDRLTADQARKRMGQRFPLLADPSATDVPEKVEGAVETVANGLFPSMVHALFQVESPGGEAADEVLRVNSQLFRFLDEIHDKGERLARLIRDCLPGLPEEPILFGGCYFAGTGLAPETQQ